MHKEDKFFEIIIIGCGMAGISTAQNFLKLMKASNQKFNLTILEARDRVGGRTFTKKFSGIPVDLGASWLEGYSKQNPIAQLSEQYNKTPSALFSNSLLKNFNGKEFNSSEFGQQQELFNIVLEEIKNITKQDTTYLDAIKKYLKENNIHFKQEYLNYFYEMIESYEGASIDQVSIFSNSDCGHIGDSFPIKEGYGSIVEEFSKGLNIKLNQIVSKIDYSNDDFILIETEKEKYKCDFVVCTIPLGCLKKDKIKFIPTLPKTKLNLINKTGMGLLDKVVLEFDQIFWGNNYFVTKLEKLKNEEIHSFLCINAIFKDAPILVGFISAEFAKQVETMKDEEVIEKSMKCLKTMFGDDVCNLKSYHVTRWWNDPFAHGSYSFDAVGFKPDDFDNLGNPIQNRLLFAGEAMINKGHSYVNGAYLSGEREANRLFNLINKN
eukprot:gene12350-6018_t